MAWDSMMPFGQLMAEFCGIEMPFGQLIAEFCGINSHKMDRKIQMEDQKENRGLE